MTNEPKTTTTTILHFMAGVAPAVEAVTLNHQEGGKVEEEADELSNQELTETILRCLQDLPSNVSRARSVLCSMFSEANPGSNNLRELLESLAALFGESAISVSDIVGKAGGGATTERLTNALYNISELDGDESDWRPLETWLEEHAGEEVGGLVLVRSMDAAVLRRWRVLFTGSISPADGVDHVLLAKELEARLADARDAVDFDEEFESLVSELELAAADRGNGGGASMQ
jgi:hypothetical protein